MAGFFSKLLRSAPEPSPEDEATLAALRRPGVLMEVGGRPKPITRETSWWGGNFIAEPPRNGLVPLVQLRADELPPALSDVIGADYLLIWIEADPARRTGPTLGLEIQRLAAPSKPLPPFETFCRLDGALACLPLAPAPAQDGMLLPHKDDAPAPLPRVKPPRSPEDEEPVTLGGWPGWIGPSQWPEGARFVMEIRSSEKGRLHLPDNGSLYLFDTPDGSWLTRSDGF